MYNQKPELNKLLFFSFCMILASCLIGGCTRTISTAVALPAETATFVPTQTSLPLSTPTQAPAAIWIDPSTPANILNQLQIPDGFPVMEGDQSAATYLFKQSLNASPAYQVYLLAAPFYTLRDQISSHILIQIWTGSRKSYQILVNEETYAVFSEKWGPPADTVQIVDSTQSLDLDQTDPKALVLLPFEEVQPKWKILKMDGLTPFTHDFNPSTYPLTAFYAFQSDQPIPGSLQVAGSQIIPNYDPEKLSIVAMTGTTALTRATAHQMDENGLTWPGKDIAPYLRDADITHISNEVSFYESCSPGNPNETSLMFCSQPRYIELLEFIGADVIDLTGNHNLDYGKKPYIESFELYKQKGMVTYAGGMTIEEAREPALMEDHGNKFAFLGCNFVGPNFAIASENHPGGRPLRFRVV